MGFFHSLDWGGMGFFHSLEWVEWDFFSLVGLGWNGIFFHLLDWVQWDSFTHWIGIFSLVGLGFFSLIVWGGMGFFQPWWHPEVSQKGNVGQELSCSPITSPGWVWGVGKVCVFPWLEIKQWTHLLNQGGQIFCHCAQRHSDYWEIILEGQLVNFKINLVNKPLKGILTSSREGRIDFQITHTHTLYSYLNIKETLCTNRSDQETCFDLADVHKKWQLMSPFMM